jgi:hypothetical protein
MFRSTVILKGFSLMSKSSWKCFNTNKNWLTFPPIRIEYMIFCLYKRSINARQFTSSQQTWKATVCKTSRRLKHYSYSAVKSVTRSFHYSTCTFCPWALYYNHLLSVKRSLYGRSQARENYHYNQEKEKNIPTSVVNYPPLSLRKIVY